MRTRDSKHADPRLIESRWLIILETSPRCQPMQGLHEQVLPWSLNTMKLFTNCSRQSHTVFRALVLCDSLFLVKQLFATSPNILSLCFYLAPENRGRVLVTATQRHALSQVMCSIQVQLPEWWSAQLQRENTGLLLQSLNVSMLI